MTARGQPRPHDRRDARDLPVLADQLSALMGVNKYELRRLSLPTLRTMNALLHDGLTGALRRQFGFKVLEDEIVVARDSGGCLSVLYLDVDGLKQLNDTAGHDAGDALLVGVIDGLVGLGVPRDHIARLGGDEFMAILPHASASDARALRRTLKETLAAHGSSVSVGTATLSPDDVADTLCLRAERGERREKRGRVGSRDHQVGNGPELSPPGV